MASESSEEMGIAGSEQESVAISNSHVYVPKANPLEADSFDEEAYLSATQQVGKLHAVAEQIHAQAPIVCTWVEFCEAQNSINPKAAPSPSTPIPMALLRIVNRTWRCCCIGLINLVLICNVLPSSWLRTSFLPLPKPGKDLSSIGGYRPIALLAPFFKLLDKLLYNRVQAIIQSQTIGLQFGGATGADEAVWLLLEVLNIMSQRDQSHIWLAFIDGESADTRPPPEMILLALWAAGLRGAEWLIFTAILGKLRGTLKIGFQSHGSWRVRCGVPQGGSLSMLLFTIMLVQLMEELRSAGCGVWLQTAENGWLLLPLIAFVDDIVLLASSPEMLQRALDITTRWSRRIRMRLNVGKEKSAIMLWGKGRTSNEWRDAQFF